MLTKGSNLLEAEPPANRLRQLEAFGLWPPAAIKPQVQSLRDVHMYDYVGTYIYINICIYIYTDTYACI